MGVCIGSSIERRPSMPKFLFCGTYTDRGLAGLQHEGAAAHRTAVEELIASAGGTLEALYWAFGEDDVYCLADLPDTVAAGAVTLAVGMTGALRVRTVVLETAEDVDAALRDAKSLTFRPPGGTEG
jgi:uncharacterized protein with GYD domain